MQFDYFYGSEAEQFTFYRIPKILITSQFFKKVSDSAKLLYGLPCPCFTLSIRPIPFSLSSSASIFVAFSVPQHICSITSFVVKKIKLSRNRKTRLSKIEKQDFRKSKVKTFGNRKTRLSKIESQDFRKSKV